MSDFDCRNELILRERHGELSAAERAALDAHLGHCASCRLSRLIGSDFEAEATLERDDGARIAALSATAERWATGAVGNVQPRKRRRARVALLAIAAAFAAVGASAAGGAFATLFGRAAPGPAPAAKAAEATIAAREKAPSTLDAPKLEAVKTEVARPDSKRRSASPSAETAASLFADASSARRAGDAERAIALYRRVENEFPTSPEAGLAGLPLGGLLLDRGDARRALAQYDRHLKGGGSGRLIPEAFYGRGRSLAALGNRAEERRTWKMLLEQFPDSPYAGHAKRRLSELGPG